MRNDWFKVGKFKHMVGMSRGDVRNLEEGSLVISVFILDTLAAFPNFNLFFFRFFYWICLFQHFITWIPLQIRNRQDELKCRVDTLGVFLNIIFDNDSKTRCLEHLDLSPVHELQASLPVLLSSLADVQLFPTGPWDTSWPCSHVSTSHSPINISKLLKM